MADDTVVIFTADHGDMLGERGPLVQDELLRRRLPDPADHRRAGRHAGGSPDNVSLLDVMPTLLDVAGVERPELADGASLVPLLGGDRQPRSRGVRRVPRRGRVAPILMIRRGA